MSSKQNEKWTREEAFRGHATFTKMRAFHVTIAGIGALGSNLAESLARQGFGQLRLIDNDRVEAINLGTQIFSTEDIGSRKVDAAESLLYRHVELEAETVGKKLTRENVKRFLRKTDLVIDAFDNHESRLVLRDYCKDSVLPCLHIGMFEGYGEVVWSSVYRVPTDIEGDVCDYASSRNLATLVVSIASEEIVNFATADEPRQKSWAITLNDFSITRY